MPPILITVFLLQLVIHLINSIGAAAINELLWRLYNKLPTPTASAVQKNLLLQREVLRLKKEMDGISAQDDFAKWARIRRQHDKVVAEHDKAAAAFQSSKTQFNSIAAAVRWIATTGLRFFMQFWFSKTPMFWMPNGWVPGYVEWLLSFPRAPIGSVSIQFWGLACASVINLVSEALISLYALIYAPKEGQKAQAQAFASSGRNTPSSRPGTPFKKDS